MERGGRKWRTAPSQCPKRDPSCQKVVQRASFGGEGIGHSSNARGAKSRVAALLRRLPAVATQAALTPSLGEVAREWGRIGCVGFGGPPAHISLLRELCVDRKEWIA